MWSWGSNRAGQERRVLYRSHACSHPSDTSMNSAGDVPPSRPCTGRGMDSLHACLREPCTLLEKPMLYKTGCADLSWRLAQ